MKKQKRRRIALRVICGLVLLLLLPPAIFQLLLSQRNQAVKSDWPLVAPLKKSDRLLIVSPHPDDETLGAGGTIATARKIGAQVRIVFMTNGDGSRSTQVIFKAREWKSGAKANPSSSQPSNLFQRIAAMRQREAVAACAKLGVARDNVIFLGYPDGGLQAMWETNWSSKTPYFSPYTKTSRSPYANAFTPDAEYSGAQATRDLEKIFRQFKPTIILTTHPEDTHPDHWAAHAYSSAVLADLRSDASESTRPWASRTRLLGFLVHHGIWPVPNGYHPEKNLLPPASLASSEMNWKIATLEQTAQNAKKAALECYVSQLATTPRYLRAFVRSNEIFDVLRTPSKNPDPPSDSLWREAWPSADIQNLNIKIDAQKITLQMRFAGAVSPRVRYRLSLHVVNPTGIQAWRIDAHRNGNVLQAKLKNLDGNLIRDNSDNDEIVLKGVLTNKGFELELPEKSLGVLPTRPMYLVSSATFSGATRLDQTSTITFARPIY